MDGLTLPLEIVSGLCALLVLLAVALLVRRVLLSRSVGSFDCSVRTGAGRHGWSVGVARYGPDRVDWFRLFSLSPRPARCYRRRSLSVVEVRSAQGEERLAVVPPTGAVRVVSCLHDGADLDLAMTSEALTGLSSWLEAAPPGQSAHVT